METGKNSQELLRFAGEGNLYQKMIEEIQDYAIIVLDINGVIQNWNIGAEKIKQYSEDDILGKHFSIFYLPEDIKNNLPQRLIAEAEDMGRSADEGWRKRKDGTKFWGSIVITAIHSDSGDVIGFCKVTRDLTDQKIAQDKLRLSEERYHQMIAEVQDYAIILLNPKGVIVNWNLGAEKIKGYTAQEIIGQNFEIFYGPEDRANGLPTKLLSIARETGRAVHEGWRLRKDGSNFWGSITITALHSKGGNIIGFSKVTRDLTERKLAEDTLAAYTAELEIQNSELEQFAYVASHDLQEPLRKIRTFSELIKENIDDKEFVERYFEKLDFAANRMVELIRSLLDYSRLLKESSIQVDLNILLSEVKQDFDLLIEEKGAKIINGSLPTVTGSHIQLQQLFSNLINNSLKFSKESPCIKITSEMVDRDMLDKNVPSTLSDTKYHLICFEDNGFGFEDQYKDKIFSLFQRLHTRHEFAGTGMGLAICKKIVENHLGFITATGEPGKGARFSIYLPVEN